MASRQGRASGGEEMATDLQDDRLSLPAKAAFLVGSCILLLAAAACGRASRDMPATPSVSSMPTPVLATPPAGDVRVALNTRPGMQVDTGLLQEAAQVYSFLWPALFNALANGDETLLQGVAEPAARQSLMARARDLGPGEHLLVKRMRQRPLVVEATAERMVVEDEAEVEAELLQEGQQPGQGSALAERWILRVVLVRTGAGWRIAEADLRWTG